MKTGALLKVSVAIASEAEEPNLVSAIQVAKQVGKTHG